MSKYKNVTALVPTGEHFDESAVGEGVWLSATHLSNIEASLENNAGALQALQTQLDTANESITNVNSLLSEANSSISTKDAEIQRLNAEITRLSALPSGKGTQVAGPKADATTEEEEEKAVKYDDPNHPANVAADKATKKYQGWRKKPA